MESRFLSVDSSSLPITAKMTADTAESAGVTEGRTGIVSRRRKFFPAAKTAMNAHSPSKKFYKVGTYAGMGFVNALDDYGSESYKAGFAMADNARVGLSKAISTVRDLINNGMDDQLTIRPVLDLSNITSGANQLNGLFNTNPSVGLLSNVRSVSSMMNRNQNGVNDDVISAIKDLGNKINASSGDTYSINGITYDDGSNVSEAVKTLTRAVKMGRRT